MKSNAALLVAIVLSLAAACAPSVPTPTPTPEPTPTPIWVQATKPEHLEGIWFNPYLEIYGGRYFLFGADGTIYGTTLNEAQEKTRHHAKFWFEDGVFYEEGGCQSIGSYRAYLQIQEGRAVRLRFERIEDSARDCYVRFYEKRFPYERVD